MKHVTQVRASMAIHRYCNVLVEGAEGLEEHVVRARVSVLLAKHKDVTNVVLAGLNWPEIIETHAHTEFGLHSGQVTVEAPTGMIPETHADYAWAAPEARLVCNLKLGTVVAIAPTVPTVPAVP